MYYDKKMEKFNELSLSMLGTGAFAGAGILGLFVAGPPIVGAFAALGIINLIIAGTITARVGYSALKLNYKALHALSKKDLFKCPKCNCADLVKTNK